MHVQRGSFLGNGYASGSVESRGVGICPYVRVWQREMEVIQDMVPVPGPWSSPRAHRAYDPHQMFWIPI